MYASLVDLVKSFSTSVYKNRCRYNREQDSQRLEVIQFIYPFASFVRISTLPCHPQTSMRTPARRRGSLLSNVRKNNCLVLSSGDLHIELFNLIDPLTVLATNTFPLSTRIRTSCHVRSRHCTQYMFPDCLTLAPWASKRA